VNSSTQFRFAKVLALTLSSAILLFGFTPPSWAADEPQTTMDVASIYIPMTPTNNRWAYDLIKSNLVNTAGITGSGIKIALLDNGIDQRVTKISSKVIGRYDATYSVSGQNDHGTGTSSIIAADPVPEAGIGGVAPGASILDVRVCLNTQCRTEWIIDGLEWAIANGANVISMSLGGGGVVEPATAKLIQEATAQGITVVVAAGNFACTPTYTNGSQTWIHNCTQTSIPGSFPGSQSTPGLITVGAIGRDLTRNSYSNYGPQVDLVAPGTEVATFYPWGPNAYFAGTSAATPLVAGVVALIKQAAPTATPEQIQAILQATTDDPVTTILDVWESCTLVSNAWQCTGLSPARWSPRYYTGAGIVNAQSAVALASQLASGVLVSGTTASVQDSAINLDWSAAVLGAGPYRVNVDGAQVTETSSTNYQVSGLNNLSQYSIQIVSASGVATIPLVATPTSTTSQLTPTISAPQAYHSAVYLSVDSEPSSNVGVLSLANGDRVSCTRSGTSFRFDCTYAMPSNSISGTFSYADPSGNFGAASNSLTWNYTGLAATSSVTISVLSETSISASWSAITGATHYCYYDAGAGEWIPTTNTSAQISGVKAGLPQTFTVYAINSSCNSAAGIISPMYWYLPFGQALLAPTNLIAQELSSTGTNINFTTPAGADRYAVYRSDGKNWITESGATFVNDIYANADIGRSFTYWITAIDDVQYGSQYGAISAGISITVPAASVQNVQNSAPSQGSAQPSSGGGAIAAPAASGGGSASGYLPPSTIVYNQKLKPNSVSIIPSAPRFQVGSTIRLTTRAKSGGRVDITVAGACVIASKSGSSTTIRATDIGKCQIYGLAQGDSKFNAADKYLTIMSSFALDTIRVSAPSRAKLGKAFKVSVTTKSKKDLTWTASGSCSFISQSNSAAMLSATGGPGNCLVSAATTEDGRWSPVGKTVKIAVR
jgi:hypothetical protein